MIGNFAFIGVAVGLLLGITGAGGAIVAIPLFVFLTGINVRDATSVSLLAVCMGAVLNWIIQRKHTDFGLGGLLFLFSLAGASLFKPVKAVAPEWVIIALFAGVGAASLVSVWRKRPSREATVERLEPSMRATFLRTSIGGFSLGGLVTMTGLGGGVVLVPFLTGFFPLTMSRAAATSLFTITLTSMFSMWIQWEPIASAVELSSGLALAGGSLVSALATRQLLKGVRPEVLDQVRKILITFVIVGSVVSLIVFK